MPAITQYLIPWVGVTGKLTQIRVLGQSIVRANHRADLLTFEFVSRHINTGKAPPKKANLPGIMTVDQCAKRLGVGRNQAYEAVHRGEIPVIRIGKRMLVPKAALERLIAGEPLAKVVA